MSFVIRYIPGTDLARRFKGQSQPYATRHQAERVREMCPNGEAMEVVECDEEVVP